MKIFIAIFLSVAMVSFGAFSHLILSERKSNKFDSYQAVLESELIQKGWIPSFIPKSAYNIEEHHRVDNPTLFVEFDFNENDISYFIKACEPINKNIYECKNNGYPVKVIITNKNHATIQSI